MSPYIYPIHLENFVSRRNAFALLLFFVHGTLYAIKLIMFLLLSKFGNNCATPKGVEVFRRSLFWGWLKVRGNKLRQAGRLCDV